MANKYDLRYWNQSITANQSFSSTIGGLIPAGKTRFLTYLRIERCLIKPIGTAVTGTSALVGSVAFSNATMVEVSAGALLPICLQSVGMSNDSGVIGPPDAAFTKHYPENPDIDKPLISVAGGASSWMMFCAYSGGPAARVYAVYYDE